MSIMIELNENREVFYVGHYKMLDYIVNMMESASNTDKCQLIEWYIRILELTEGKNERTSS